MNFKSIKKASISVGLYRPARILHRRLFRSEMDTYNSDKSLYSHLLPSNDLLCFDVGANIGRMSEVLLELGHKLVAFEPQEECVREIKARCKPYRERLQIEETALGDSPGSASLFVRELNGQSSMRSKWEGKITGAVQVPLSTLDLAIRKYGIPHYCKIDVEGWELQVLRGLNQPIPLISFEYHQENGEMQNAFACLERLCSMARIEVNIAPREQSLLSLSRWLELDEFTTTFQAQFKGREEYMYGDLYVRMK